MTPLHHQWIEHHEQRQSQRQSQSQDQDHHQKRKGSVSNRIEEIIEASKLPPGEQALNPKHRLTTKVARPKKGRKKKGGGLEPILEHHDIKDDPYYMKPPLPTHVK
jgi:hypothetical protein